MSARIICSSNRWTSEVDGVDCPPPKTMVRKEVNHPELAFAVHRCSKSFSIILAVCIFSSSYEITPFWKKQRVRTEFIQRLLWFTLD